MLGQWLSDIFSNKPHSSVTKQIQTHYTSIFRELLLGGILFLLLVSRLCRDPGHVIHTRHREYSDQRLSALQRYSTWFCNRHDVSPV
jgi:hypothetical protein